MNKNNHNLYRSTNVPEMYRKRELFKDNWTFAANVKPYGDKVALQYVLKSYAFVRIQFDTVYASWCRLEMD